MELLWILIALLSGSMGNSDLSHSQFVENFRKEALDRHNLFRQGYFGTQPLALNPQLCQTSQARADEWSQNSVLSENFTPSYGENTYVITLSKNDKVYGSTPVDEWYDQIHDYDFTTGENAPNTKSEIDSFTQVVWKGTKEMCISFAIGVNNELGTRILYVVAHYNPEGSIKGAHAENVKPIFLSSNFIVNSKHAPKPKHFTPPITLPDAIIPDTQRIGEKHSKIKGCGMFPKETNVSTPIDWIEEAIHVANGYREFHGVPDLVHDLVLDQVAQKLVNSFAELSFLSTPKSKMHRCGETVFTKFGNHIDPAEPFSDWYKQVHIYDFQHHRSRDKKHSVDSFTQLVWKGTKQIGIAYAKNDGKIYVVAVYSPGGNKANEYKRNVLSGGNGNKAGALLMIVTFLGLAYQLLKK